ncbi:MAG: DUF3108 domain-containing protein, partial [Muribaculaceae bacterium]|nr:DUF3108 domain-containing protein [Muribaculaceae bacterium]
MRRFLSSLILSLALTARLAAGSPLPSSSERIAPEDLQYKVMFKWGLINKQAGSAHLSLKHEKDGYHSLLAASSAPWADKIYRVRDTLLCHMDYQGMKPRTYVKIANEAAEHKHDRVEFHYSSRPGVSADCYRKVFSKGQLKVDEHKRFESDSCAVDMLSAFYLMRTLPYQDWMPGHEYKVPIFSGKQKETLTIRYQGLSDVKIDNKSYPSYHITFIFTSKGGTKSSDDMDAWISSDKKRIPLRLEGKL